MILAAKIGGCLAVGAALAAVVQNTPDPIERYTVLTLLAAVVLGVGGGGLKLLMGMKDALAANTLSNQALNQSIQTLATQSAEALRVGSVERDRAVGAIKDHIDTRIDKVVEKIENTCGGAA